MVKGIAILLTVIAIFCFVPMVKVTYPTVANKLVVEEYTATEPYTILEETTVPYITYTERAEWVDDGSWDYAANYVAFTAEEYMAVSDAVTPGRWVINQSPTTKYRTEMKEVVKYREVTKTRMVVRPTIMYEWKRVSLSQGFFWR